MESYLGQISYFAYTRPIQGWLPCNGQLLSVQQYAPLFSLLGTTYGGDGRTTFALPNLQGHLVVGAAPNQPVQGGQSNMTVPASTNVVEAAAPVEGGEKVTAQIPAAQTVPLPLPPYVGLGAYICVEGLYPAYPQDY
ncbi:phage tail protein [Niveispirillum sp. SYP-B3756]|uniref:phage tail protein n=1 Tax=Niveispirillum sp. SYP-B3756 TaxID=2662178 RepID=UPI0012929574|nr:tail fiber protein [Niveispirillum sp. SYP-B3756]MQP68036.1 phage tail protein [Niveispirillum sp. SYP-B3756]